MQSTQDKRRISILKKRRSRSLSPKSPTKEQQSARRASRRISFSGKHNVREFFTNENTAIVWGETYDVSTEKHVLSNEQVTLQSTRSSSMASSTLQVTRNESTVMDISNVPNASAAAVNVKPLTITRLPTPRQSYSQDQKENIMFADDTEMELSLVFPAPKPASTERSSIFNFARKSDASVTLRPGEKTSGSDNMDISGVELTLPSNDCPPAQTVSSGNYYRDWLKQNNIGAARVRRESNYSPIDLSDSSIVSLHEAPKSSNSVSSNRRKTCIQETSMALEPTSQSYPNKSSNIMTQSILNITPMKLDETIEKPVNASKHRDTIGNEWETMIKDESIALDNSVMSGPLQVTRSELTVADVTNVPNASTTVANEKSLNITRPSALRQSYSQDQKENIMFASDNDMELSLIMQPSVKAAPSKRPTLFDFSNHKFGACVTLRPGEKTSGSDNMDISGIEPTLLGYESPNRTASALHSHESPNRTASAGSNCRDWPKPNNNVEAHANESKLSAIEISDSSIASLPEAPKIFSAMISNRRRTCAQEMPMALEPTPKSYANQTSNIHHQNNIEAMRVRRESNFSPIEISDSSIASLHEAPRATNSVSNDRRKTCIQEMSMALDTTSKSYANKTSNFMTQSILNITPMKLDESIEKLEKEIKRQDKIENDWLTIIKNETIALNSPLNLRDSSTGLDESKQLTFIEDDDEEDQICNTKLDLASSLEGSDINDIVQRRSASFNYTGMNMSRFSLASMNSEQMPSAKDANQSNIDESNSMPAQSLNFAELEAFRKSRRMRHSNVFAANTSTDTSPDESVAEEKSLPIHKKDESTDNRISIGPIGRSSILQRRSSFGLNNEANETSFLRKSIADKPLSQIKLDFSGYDQFVGLATPQDVFKDFSNRMDQIKLKSQNWAEQRKKYENGEIESLDVLNNNSDALVSQNVEAPSWASLYMNKIKCEEEQQQAAFDREWEERLIGAFLPAIPDINILTLNKCRFMRNWTFDDIWFFRGNIHLRNIRMPAFKVCLIYDPDTVEKSVSTYGTLKFMKINQQFCRKHLASRECALSLLEMRELASKLPKNLLPLCETSSQLSNFDDRLNEYCINAQKKVNELKEICMESKAVIKEENGVIFILKVMVDFKRQEFQDYIIELSDIDCTGWRDVRTNPQRLWNDEIKSLPKGIAFIRELLANGTKYIQWE